VDHSVDLVLLAGCALLLVAVLAVRLSSRTGVPALLVYLAIGLAIGEAGLGVRFEDYQLTADLGLVALAVILAEGGLTTRWSQVRGSLAVAAVLSTVGVLISVAVVGALAVLLLDTSIRTALLLGAAVASTDAAAVFSVLRRLPLKSRVRSVLEAESGLNDAPTVVLVTLASSSTWGSTGAFEVALLVTYELVVGLLVGLAVGWIGRLTLGRLALPSAGLYPIATFALVLLAFGAGGALHASGFLAVYVAGLVVGSARLPHRRAVLGFATWPRRTGCSAPCPPPSSSAVARCCSPGRWRSSCRPRRSGCRGVSRRSWPGPGCAAPSRSCSPPSRCRPAYRMAPTCSTWCSCWWSSTPWCRPPRCPGSAGASASSRTSRPVT
jgi:cell volume regulation protein A